MIKVSVTRKPEEKWGYNAVRGYTIVQADSPVTICLSTTVEPPALAGQRLIEVYAGKVDPNDPDEEPIATFADPAIFAKEAEYYPKPASQKKPYRVWRFGKTSHGVGSNIGRYYAEETRNLRITHSSDAKLKSKGLWQHWLNSYGLVSWMIETAMDAAQTLEYLELEGMFGG